MIGNIQVKKRGGNVRGIARTAKKEIEQLLELAAITGVPAAQRDPDMLASMKVPQIGTGPTVAERTVRRLTRVERLLRAEVLERHEADACEWYAERAALAWDTTGCTANYEGGGSGGGSAHAPDRLMAKNRDVAWARDDHREARSLLGKTMADAFEAIVCRNEALGPTAAAAFPDLARSAAGDRMRRTLKFCANIIHSHFAKQMGWSDMPVVPNSRPAAKPTPAPAAAVASPSFAIAKELTSAIERRSTSPGAELWIAEDMAMALAKEVAGPTPILAIETFGGLPVMIRSNWRWGWVIVELDPFAPAA